eukprot:SAG11_NODE_5462_length_1552_cov_7.290434_2_plen_250_part_00
MYPTAETADGLSAIFALRARSCGRVCVSQRRRSRRGRSKEEGAAANQDGGIAWRHVCGRQQVKMDQIRADQIRSPLILHERPSRPFRRTFLPVSTLQGSVTRGRKHLHLMFGPHETFCRSELTSREGRRYFGAELRDALLDSAGWLSRDSSVCLACVRARQTARRIPQTSALRFPLSFGAANRTAASAQASSNSASLASFAGRNDASHLRDRFRNRSQRIKRLVCQGTARSGQPVAECAKSQTLQLRGV